MSPNDLQRLKTYRKAIPGKTYVEDPDKNGRINYYIGNNEGKLRIISKQEYDSIVNPVTPVVNNVTNITGTTFVAGGDLSGTATNQTVEKILNNTVPVDAVGSLTNDGVGNLSWTPGGAGYITSILDTTTIDLDVTLGVLTANFINAAGYITGAQVPANEADPVFVTWLATPPNISIFTNDVPYLTSIPADYISSILDTTTIDLNVSGGGQLTANFINAAGYLDTTAANLLYQPLDADLTSIAATGYVSTSFLKKTAANTWALDTNTYLTSVTGHNLLSVTHPDTVAASPVRGDIIAGNSTPAWTKLALGTIGKILRSDGTDLVYTTCTYPTTTTINRILYSSANDVVGQITTANSSVLVTDGSGVPSLSTTLPAVTLNTATVATTQAANNNSTKVATTAYVDTATGVIAVDPTIKTYQSLGSNIISQTCGFPFNRIIGASSIGTDGQVVFIALDYIYVAQTITGVLWWQSVISSGTFDNNNKVGLYSYSGGTLTLVASSTNDANIWKTFANNTLGNKAFTTPYAAAAGQYFVGYIYNTSVTGTAAQFGGTTNAVAAGLQAMNFTNSAKLIGTVSGQTDLPATQAMSGVTSVITTIWAGIY